MTEEDLINSILASVEQEIRKVLQKEGDIMIVQNGKTCVCIDFMNGASYVQPLIDKKIGLIPENQEIKN